MNPPKTEGLTTRLADPRRVQVRTLRAGVETQDGVTPEAIREGEILTIGSADGNDLVIQDRTVSGYHLELRAVSKGIEVIDLGSTNGTFLGDMRIHRAVVPPRSVLRVGRTRLRLSEGIEGQASLSAFDGRFGLIGNSESMQRLFARIEKVAPSGVGALLYGESGTGKELVAKAFHELSFDNTKPFVTVDCGAISPNLVASELFGHEKGSFTGATSLHRGAFERAHDGLLFLDEIGELPAALQPQLLGVLERGRFRRVGGSKDVTVNVRVVSATHRDLRREVNEGTFRLDLYYRIAQVVLTLPPLRERRDDISLLVRHFLDECGHTGSVEEIFSEENQSSLKRHRWPGNVRELRNYVEATLALGESSELPWKSTADEEPGSNLLNRTSYKEARARVLEEFERSYLTALMKSSDGNVSAAAREARMDRTYLQKLLSRHGLR